MIRERSGYSEKKWHRISYDLKRQIGIVLQNVAVFEELTVYENIDYFCGLYVKEKKKRQGAGRGSHSFCGVGRLSENAAEEAYPGDYCAG